MNSFDKSTDVRFEPTARATNVDDAPRMTTSSNCLLNNSETPIIISLAGPAEIDYALRKICDESINEIVSFSPGVLTQEEIDLTHDRNEGMYSKGLHSRTVYLSTIRNDKAILAHVKWLNERGSEVRTIATLPQRMIIADSKIVVLPIRTSDPRAGVEIHRSASVALGMQTLFETIWKIATPLGLTTGRDKSVLSSEERAVLELLALGRSDKEVAKTLGISERTLGRHMANLQAQFKTSTRFATAYQAVKQRWI